MQFSIDLGLNTAVGCNIPNRHDQIPYADRWILALYGSKIQIDSPLRTHYMARRGYWRIHEGLRTYTYPVRMSAIS